MRRRKPKPNYEHIAELEKSELGINDEPVSKPSGEKSGESQKREWYSGNLYTAYGWSATGPPASATTTHAFHDFFGPTKLRPVRLYDHKGRPLL